MLVVIVDDNNIDVMIAKKIVRKQFPNIDITTYTKGKEFLTHLEDNLATEYAAHSHIFFLLDMYLTDMNGVDVAKKVVALGSDHPGLHCYLLSAAIDGDQVTDVSKYQEIEGFISKPLTPETISSIILNN